MWRLSVILLIWLMNLVSGLDKSFEKRHTKVDIIDGNTTSIAFHPYQVSIWCGPEFRGSGALLSGRWVVTTASIVVGFDAPSLSVRYHSSSATTGGNLLYLARVLTHPRFNYSTMQHDVALLLLRRDCSLRGDLTRVRLAASPLPDNTTAMLSGWGSTSNMTKMNDSLHQVWERTLTWSSCQQAFNQSFRISKSQFCTQAIDAFGPCWGDNGDLLMIGGKLYGLLSWNHGCYSKAAPSVFTQICSVRRWIFHVMKKHHPRRKANP